MNRWPLSWLEKAWDVMKLVVVPSRWAADQLNRYLRDAATVCRTAGHQLPTTTEPGTSATCGRCTVVREVDSRGVVHYWYPKTTTHRGGARG